MGFDANDLARLGPGARSQVMEQLLKQHAAPSPAKKKANKYGAIKVKTNGIQFDSKKESNRYQELMLMLQAGKIRDLRLQQEFLLQPSYTTPEGERVRSIKYVADFVYEQAYQVSLTSASTPYTAWEKIVEDVKSPATRKNRVYRMKKKMMQDKFGITIREV